MMYYGQIYSRAVYDKNFVQRPSVKKVQIIGG